MVRAFGSLLTVGLVGVPAAVMAAVPEPDIPVNATGWHVVINMPQTRLFVYQDGQLKKSYPVAVGKMLTQTPVGSYGVTGIVKDPTWHVPKSIQEEMRKQGKTVETEVPPGPKNPLGKVFMRIGEPRLGLGMHGTNAPGSVPGFRSHGCIRLKNEDALELAGTIKVGAAVTMAYQSVLLNQDNDGQLWLTAYRDQYKQRDAYLKALASALLAWQREHKVAVHGYRVDSALKERAGKPVCLTCIGGRIAPKLGGNSAIVVRWSNEAMRDVAASSPAEVVQVKEKNSASANPHSPTATKPESLQQNSVDAIF